MVLHEQNIYPSEELNAQNKPQWDVSKCTKEQELSVLTVGPKTFIGAQEATANTKYTEGSLFVDEDDTVLCYVHKMHFLHAFSDKELGMLLRSPVDCV